MSVTAKNLSKSGARGKDLDAVVREQLQIIDDKLLRADRTWGRNVVVHDLPTVLALPGLDKKDAQRIVYSSILRSLDRRGFETRIILEDDFTKIAIAWMTDLDAEEVEAMNALIRAKRIQNGMLQDFVQQPARAPAPPMTASSDGGLRPPVRGGAPALPRGAPPHMSPAERALHRA
jgi:hypothetical protein